MTTRRRTLLIALPLAVVFALWAGPGLSPDDGEGAPPAAPATAEPAPPAPVLEAPECEAPPDPGPDGDL